MSRGAHGLISIKYVVAKDHRHKVNTDTKIFDMRSLMPRYYYNGLSYYFSRNTWRQQWVGDDHNGLAKPIMTTSLIDNWFLIVVHRAQWKTNRSKINVTFRYSVCRGLWSVAQRYYTQTVSCTSVGSWTLTTSCKSSRGKARSTWRAGSSTDGLGKNLFTIFSGVEIC